MTDDNDGVALQSVPHPLEITDAMLDAGEKVHQGLWWQQLGLSERDVPAPLPRAVLAEIYTAMVHAAPPEPGDLNEASLEHALVEIGLHEDTVERFAEQCALGNNGGSWAEHYTETQKEVWRAFVRGLADEIFSAPRLMRMLPKDEHDAE